MITGMSVRDNTVLGGKRYFLICVIFLLATGCSQSASVKNVQKQPVTSTMPEVSTSTIKSLSLPIKYNNKKYGFIFSLPADWQGFSIYTTSWSGGDKNGKQTETGPIINIRNPKWTQAKPYEDIPVMVFTIDQWKSVIAEKLIVSAAPFGPSKLGSNNLYVFALPARYNYDFSTGYEDVEKIIGSNPLKGY